MSFSDLRIIQVDENTGRVSLKIQAKVVSGFEKLIQIVVIGLLNSPGRDVLDPDRGSGLPLLVGSNISVNDSSELFGEVAQGVSAIQEEVTNSQIGLDETDEEKLREIKIMRIIPGDSIDEVLVRLRIVNEAGQASDVVV